MGVRVVTAAGDLPVSVVCDDEDVAAWAIANGAAVIWSPGVGLNGAVTDGVSQLAAAGAVAGIRRRLAAGGGIEVIAPPADLPLADDLTRLAGFAGVTFVPDRHGDG